MTDLTEGIVLMGWFRSIAQELNTRFPTLCEAEELHRILQEALREGADR